MSTIGWSGAGRAAERMSWWLMGAAALAQGKPAILPERLSFPGTRPGEDDDATAAGARYAGVWRQNSDRPDWPLRSKVDAIIKQELDDHDVPGFSVAVSHHGNVVYQRGFGHQDKAAGVWMHGGSVNRIASVSKAVAGVLALRMEAKHPGLGMTDKVRTHLPWLPAKHDYTVGQTAMNRSCVKSYPAPMTTQNQTQYDTAKQAARPRAPQVAWRTRNASTSSSSPSRFARLPVEKLSRPRTVWPSRSSCCASGRRTRRSRRPRRRAARSA